MEIIKNIFGTCAQSPPPPPPGPVVELVYYYGDSSNPFLPTLDAWQCGLQLLDDNYQPGVFKFEITNVNNYYDPNASTNYYSGATVRLPLKVSKPWPDAVIISFMQDSEYSGTVLANFFVVHLEVDGCVTPTDYDWEWPTNPGGQPCNDAYPFDFVHLARLDMAATTVPIYTDKTTIAAGRTDVAPLDPVKAVNLLMGYKPISESYGAKDLFLEISGLKVWFLYY
jgi:hypothetical protein